MQRDILWKSGIIAAVVFIAGFAAVVYLDNQQTEDLKNSLTDVGLRMDDARITGLYYQVFSGNTGFCSAAFGSNQKFSVDLHDQGLLIEKLEEVNKFSPDLLQEKERYALLQMQYWLNALQLREKCGFKYSTIVYFYSHYDESLKNLQNAESIALLDAQNSCQNRPILVPLPIDLNISVVEILASQYGIEKAPALLVDGKVYEGVWTVDQIKSFINCS